ncbi:hypothetical protein ACR76M_15920 [Enterococcus innesii]|uniref:hypothetical protein n=1 Tax=Enterococcus innesii TaxID=2839759 RepID=UPI003DA36BCF
MRVIDKKKKKYKSPVKKTLFTKVCQFVYYKFFDTKKKDRSAFNEYGLTMYVGMQGDGKTVSLVEKLEEIRHDYPDVLICTNFGYEKEDIPLVDWLQILEIRNDRGVVFAIDEIQNEFDVYDARNFNMQILRTVTQQRKQGIKMFGTSQVFTRVAKPLREQTFEVVECKTVLGRWTFQRCFRADEYNMIIDNPDKKAKQKRKWRKNFIQTDSLRNMYDSYKVIEEMAKLERKARQRESKIA